MQLRPPKNPNLPLAPLVYDSGYHERQNNALRSYFNTLDASFRQLLLGCNHYGCFHSTVNQTAAVANVAYAVTFDLTHHAYGISVGGTPADTITVTVGGVYLFAFNAQLDSTGGTGLHAYFWARINGVDESNSANKIVVDSGNREKVAGWSYSLELQAGDTMQLMWSVSDTRVYLKSEIAAPPVPAISSCSLNAAWQFPASFG